MSNPRFMCRKHLLGEHGELHKFRHMFIKGHRIEGRRGQIEPAAMKYRHDELAREMVRRGYRHESPYEQPDLSGYDLAGFTVDRAESTKELFKRCCDCKSQYRQQLMEPSNVPY